MDLPGDVRDLTDDLLATGVAPALVQRAREMLAQHAAEAGYWLELAAVLRRQGDFPAALAVYDYAGRRFPTLPQWWNNKAALLTLWGRLDDALVAVDRAIGLDPSYLNALETKGHIFELAGMPEDAEPIYQQVLAADSYRIVSWTNIGSCRRLRGDASGAVAAYRRALQLDPDHLAALFNLAGVLWQLGDDAVAVERLDRLLQLDSRDGAAAELRRRILAGEPSSALASPMLTSAERFGSPENPGISTEARVLGELLRRSKTLNDQAGFLGWDPAKLAADPVGDPGRSIVRLPPPSRESPRLFLSYSWARDRSAFFDSEVYEFDMWMDAFAGSLFNRGYRVVYDRDPRNLDKGLSALDVVWRMNDCNYFVPVVSAQYAEAVGSGRPARVGWGTAEWDHACRLYERGFLQFAGIWYSGATLPVPLKASATADIRADPSPWGTAIQRIFPNGGRPSVPAPTRPPDPEYWPAFRS